MSEQQKLVGLFEEMLNRPKAEKYELAEVIGMHFICGYDGGVHDFPNMLKLCDFLEDDWRKKLIFELSVLIGLDSAATKYMLLLFYLYVHTGRHDTANCKQVVFKWIDSILKYRPSHTSLMQALKPLIK